jgi:membrane-associated phospholipid phosphatase
MLKNHRQMPTHQADPRAQADGTVQADPTVQAAPPGRWRVWVALLSRQPQRLAGFGSTVLVGFGLSVLLIYLFGWLASEVVEQNTTRLDEAAAAALTAHASPQLDVLAQAVSFMGSEAVLIGGSLLVALFLIQRRWGAAGMLLLITLGAQLLNDVLKEVFHRTRPEPLAGWIASQQYSFPSGHAMVSAAFYGYLAYLAWRLLPGVWRWVAAVGLLLLVVAIGVSRLYLQAHFLSDVIAGYLSGGLWTNACILGSQLLVLRRERRPSGSRQPRTVKA